MDMFIFSVPMAMVGFGNFVVFVLLEDNNMPLSEPLKTDTQNMLLNELCAEI
jgi:hypothetical protein